MPRIYLCTVGRRIPHRGYLTCCCRTHFPRKNASPARAAFSTFEGNIYGFATMSNSTRSSSFTFTAPPPMLMGSIPKSLCFSWAEP